jgi:hypothetical protein
VEGNLVPLEVSAPSPWNDGRTYGATIAVRFVADVSPPVFPKFPRRVGFKVDEDFGISTNDLLSSFFELREDQHLKLMLAAFGSTAIPEVTKTIGVPYVPAGTHPGVTFKDPWGIDPDKVDRGNAAHRHTQDAAAAFLEQNGLAPRSPEKGEPECDLLWMADGNQRLVVAEVKSLTDANEEQQLRLGLGQLLRYRQCYAQLKSLPVDGVLIGEREPTDSTWGSLCEALGIVLVWPDSFLRMIQHPSSFAVEAIVQPALTLASTD